MAKKSFLSLLICILLSSSSLAQAKAEFNFSEFENRDLKFKIPKTASRASGAEQEEIYFCRDPQHGSEKNLFECAAFRPDGTLVLYGTYNLFKITGTLKYEKVQKVYAANDLNKLGYDSGGVSEIALAKEDLTLFPRTVSLMTRFPSGKLDFFFVDRKLVELKDGDSIVLPRGKNP